MPEKHGKSEDERIRDLEEQMIQVTSQLSALGDALADIRDLLSLQQPQPGAARAILQTVPGLANPILFGASPPSHVAEHLRQCRRPVPISGFGDRRCDGRSLEVWSATDGQKHSITVNIENTGDCDLRYKGTDGTPIEIRVGQKKTITDFTRRFIVDCRGGEGQCRLVYDGSVC